EQSLNGLWKFHYAQNPGQTIEGFQALGFDVGGWDNIAVPERIQLAGYGRPQYTNTQYPWDGRETVEPGQVPSRDNPVGSYVRTYTLERPLAPGERLAVSFFGAQSAVVVWHNGVYVGYACDSFTPSEFDLSKTWLPGENRLAVQVFMWCGASWIEDQDMYRFSGLFRDVLLLRRPAVHAQDVRVTTALSDDLADAVVTVRVMLEGRGAARVALEGAGELLGGDGDLVVRLAHPHLWSPEDPFLYHLMIEVRDETGAITEVVPLNVGVRRFGIEHGVLSLNGKRIVFHGVNRHEFGPGCGVMTREQAEADIRLMKANNIDAIRTSHYPNASYFYDLADEYGLLVIDEMNLESHGLMDSVQARRLTVEQAVPGDRPEWLPALLDRAASMAERDKNHACVVMWSCGNESFGGADILAVADWFRSVDNRPVHYEGIRWDPRYPLTSDVVSRMYSPVAEIEEYLRTHRDKPFMLCEFAHAMGNSFGAVDEYIDLADREPLFQGGFIWDFADQAIALHDRQGRAYFGYGGDCGEAPHDGEFCGDGIVFADHTPSPKLQEVRYLYQPFRVTVTRHGFTLANRHLFTSSAGYDCVATLRREGVVLAEGMIATGVAPGSSVGYALPFVVPNAPGEYTVDVSLRLRVATAWAPAGDEIAWGQSVFPVAGGWAPSCPRATAPEIVDGIHNVGVRGEHFAALFSKLSGGLVSYRHGAARDGGNELLRAVPRPNFWHAPTSNERGWKAPFFDGPWLLASRYAIVDPQAASPVVAVHGDGVEVTYHYLLPTTPASACDVTYLVDGAGRVEVTQTVRPGAGLGDMPELGMLFEVPAELHRLRWYGEGPDECYVDRRNGARLGVYGADVTSELTPYLRPQEAGNHTGVRWAEVTDDRGAGLRVECVGGMEFSALPWTPFEIENAPHHVELPPVHRTVLRPALMRRGVGGDDSWGARTHPQYLLPTGQELVFSFAFRGIEDVGGTRVTRSGPAVRSGQWRQASHTPRRYWMPSARS
ncbi:MAG: DUF4981 domain-containing protein, partial [Micrococcales bacterium]|nr:DUF4981 domain-containing protein [Micrococcales bacterium]